MPYRVYIEAEILRIEFIGVIQRPELVEVLREVESAELSQNVTPHRITDLSAWDDSENGFSEILEIASQRKQRRFPNAFKSALVASKPVTWGIARSFQTLNDHPQITIRIFSELSAAQAWIAEP